MFALRERLVYAIPAPSALSDAATVCLGANASQGCHNGRLPSAALRRLTNPGILGLTRPSGTVHTGNGCISQSRG